MIVSDPDIRDGRPCIDGTGLRVIDLVMAHLFRSRTPSELASDYGIALAEVHAALAYYYGHKSELDEDIRAQLLKAQNYREQRAGTGQ
ncbi:MAG: DUF433 domain-containing protein [Anaerolineae bacterium]|nr:DUF433 domain-containing protein [Anaerolineae bacterium]